MQGMRKTTGDVIYEHLRNRIISLSLKPGEELPILELSKELGVSRSPVRDALMRLQGEALVEIVPQKGCWVKAIDVERAAEERFLRASLEKSVLQRFAESMKPSAITRLEYYLQLQKEAAERRDGAAFYSSDDMMHATFFEETGLSRLWRVIERESGDYRRIRILSLDSDGIYEKNMEQHRCLIDALKNSDIEKALEIENEHLSKVVFELDGIIGKHPGYFCNGRRK